MEDHMGLPDFVRQNLPLANHSTLCVGGSADYFADIAVDSKTPGAPFINAQNLIEAYEFARKNGLDIFTLGRGSNVLFSDRGFPGLIIHMNLREWYYHYMDDELSADAGVLISEIVFLGENFGFSGFESFAGLPGTVGGAIYGNAGCYGKQFWDIIEAVNYFDGSYLKQIPASPELYNYRWSFFKDRPNYVIVSAKLKIEPEDKDFVIMETKRIRGLRYANQPTQASVGCIFKNPLDGRSAGKLIDDCGLKGLQVGQAMISREHANFFVNIGGAKANDFIELIKIAKGRVFEKSGTLLKEEIILVGEF